MLVCIVYVVFYEKRMIIVSKMTGVTAVMRTLLINS